MRSDNEEEPRGAPRFPHADDITIPDDVTLEQLEPADIRDEQPARDGRGFGGRLGRILRRVGSRARLAFDWLLLTITFPAPVLILAYQSFEWLRTSAWPPVPVERLFHLLQLDPGTLAHTPWPGLSHILEWLFAAPLTIVLFGVGLGLHLLSGLLFPRIAMD